MAKPKLLVVTSTFPRWQNDTDPPFVYELSKRLVKDFEVKVHAPHYPGSKTNELVDGIEVHRFRYCICPLEKLAGSSGILPTLRRNRLYYLLVPLFLLAQFFSLLTVVVKTKPGVIHAHWVLPQGLFATILGKMFGVPVVVTAHGGDIFALQSKLMRRIKRYVLKSSDRITVVSYALREKILTEILSVGINVIPMGVSSEKFSPEKKSDKIKEKYQLNDKTMIYVGRLSEKKGVEYLIKAVPLILENFPSAKLLIVGFGELETQLQGLVNMLDLQKNIIFIGGVPNEKLPEYYASSAVFIGPSIKARGGDTEGFGLTFVEAAMSGCLLVGSNVGGIQDIIEDRVTGYLVPEKDSQAIAAKIIYAFQNNHEMTEIVKNGRAKCMERFSFGVIAQQYKKILMGLVKG